MFIQGKRGGRIEHRSCQASHCIIVSCWGGGVEQGEEGQVSSCPLYVLNFMDDYKSQIE